MSIRVLHFTSDDEDTGDEYVVFLESRDNTPAEDHEIPGFNLYDEGTVEFYGSVEGAFPFGEALQKRR